MLRPGNSGWARGPISPAGTANCPDPGGFVPVNRLPEGEP